MTFPTVLRYPSLPEPRPALEDLYILYPVIGELPSLDGIVQDRLICDVEMAFAASPAGGDDTVAGTVPVLVIATVSDRPKGSELDAKVPVWWMIYTASDIVTVSKVDVEELVLCIDTASDMLKVPENERIIGG